MKPIVLGLSGIAITGTGITGYYFYSRPSKQETIKDKLSSFRLISSLTTDKNEMDKQWQEEFNIDKDEIKKIIAGITNDNNGGKALSNWCNDNLSKPVSEPLLSNVKRWCTVGTIESKIGRNKNFIRTEAAQEWENIWNKNSDQAKRQKVGITENKSDRTKTTDVSKIQSFCEENKKKDFLAKEKSTVYDEVLSWCVKS